VQFVRTYEDYDGDDGTVRNSVKFLYNDLWQITKVFQQHDGDVSESTSPKVEYTYTIDELDDGNHSQLAKMTYPSGHALEYSYNKNAPDDRINRVRSLTFKNKLSGNLVTPQAKYDYIGLNMFAKVDYTEPDVMLDRTAEHNGDRAVGVYPGFDRYGRVQRHLWVDGDFEEHPSDTTVPNVPPIVETVYGYDNASNRTLAWDARPGANLPLDYQYVYDKLHRLNEAYRGHQDSGEVPVGAGSEQWSLDALGNWKKYIEETDDQGEAFEEDVDDTYDRTHDKLNILKEYTLNGGSGNFDLTTDLAGNVKSREVSDTAADKLKYTHDAWDRLVKVEYDDGTSETRGEYEYNGLNWRVIRKHDSDLDGDLDRKNVILFNASWQMVEERIDDDYQSSSGINRHKQYVWGIRYIDDLILHRHDSDKDNNYAEEDRFYHLTDAQFSTVAIIDQTAEVQERVTYTPYGRARHHWLGDVDGNGSVSVADYTDIVQQYGQDIDDAGYEAQLDVNRDGTISSLDQTLASSQGLKAALANGLISDPATVDNQIGYDGYVFNAEAELYCVRFRTYDPWLGRWLERDPIGTLSGMNLFLYTSASPVLGLDPTGLITWGVGRREDLLDWMHGMESNRTNSHGDVNAGDRCSEGDRPLYHQRSKTGPDSFFACTVKVGKGRPREGGSFGASDTSLTLLELLLGTLQSVRGGASSGLGAALSMPTEPGEFTYWMTLMRLHIVDYEILECVPDCDDCSTWSYQVSDESETMAFLMILEQQEITFQRSLGGSLNWSPDRSYLITMPSTPSDLADCERLANEFHFKELGLDRGKLSADEVEEIFESAPLRNIEDARIDRSEVRRRFKQCWSRPPST
jgi:RHS repeat-associated protein